MLKRVKLQKIFAEIFARFKYYAYLCQRNQRTIHIINNLTHNVYIMELANINISLSISEEGIKSLGQAIAEGLINASSTADAIAKDVVSQLLKKALSGVSANTAPTGNTDDVIIDTTDTIVEKTVRPNKNSDELKIVDMQLIRRIYDTIIEDMHYIEPDYSNLTEVNEMLKADIEKLTKGFIVVRFGNFKGHILSNFRECVAMRMNHHEKWVGYVKQENIIPELIKAYENKNRMVDVIPTPPISTQVVTKNTGTRRSSSNNGNTSSDATSSPRTYSENLDDSTTPLSGKKQHHRSVSGYTKGSYTRITPGSNIIRMRRKKGNRLNGPMLIDREFASDLMERSLTHVRIDTNNGMCLKFTKEDVPTYSPKRNKTISRLRVHATNRQSGVPATFCINGGEFQKTIMKTMGTFVEPGGEALFRFKVISDQHDECVIRMENYL